MKENEDYIIAENPNSAEEFDWTVIINKGEWKDFVVKYNNIEIVEENSFIDYNLEILFVPERLREVSVTEKPLIEFNKYCAILIENIMSDFDEKKINVYIDKETGKKIEY
tara:strand:+ start:424 stop:753 length:330 start_codon:yes stop_codon:yes gene_type:complete